MNNKQLIAVALGLAAAAGSAQTAEDGGALQRTLVREGAAVLPAAAFELIPQLASARWSAGHGAGLRHGTAASLGLRLGLPGDAQLQLDVPYVRNSTALASASGLGDVDLAFTKSLLRESAGGPGLLATVGYTAATGDDGFASGVPLGAGVHAWRAGLTAVKTLDSVVAFGSLTYTAPSSTSISGVAYAPGDVAGMRLGGAMAVRAGTALSMGLNFGRARSSRVGGIAVPGTNASYGSLWFGVGTALGHNAMLNVGADLRITGNLPSTRLTVSLPVRF